MRFFSAIFLSVVLTAGPAWAGCGSASCPVDTSGERPQEKGWVEVGYQFEYIEQDQHRIGTRRADFREIPGHHDEEFTVNRVHRGLASIGLTGRLGLELQLPFVSRSHAHIHRHRGADILESWDIEGWGDLVARLKYAFWVPESRRKPTLSAILGGEFPTGASHEKNEAEEEAEAGIQPGSDSYDLIAGLSTRQEFSAPMARGGHGTLPIFSSVIGQLNGPGNDDYRLGDTLQVNLGTAYPLVNRVSLLGQLNFLLRDKDGQGRTGEEIGKTGGEFLYLSPGIEFRPAENWRAFALIQLPVYRRVNSTQLVSDYNVLFGATFRFKAFGKR